MGKALIAASVLLAACQSMYAAKPEKLKAPPAHRPPKQEPTPVATVTVVEDCNVNFSAPPTTQRQTKIATQKIAAGDAAVQTAEKTKGDEQRVALVRQAIDTYSEALRKDPYNAEATLKLALSYDHLLRKGCALALLKRLGQLADHPKLGSDAKLQAGLVHQNTHWFKLYRIEALKQIP